MRVVKRVGKIVARIVVTIVLTFAVASVAVELISWNFLKPRIAAQVESATGRELFIGGDVDIDILPRPRIVLRDLGLANPEWVETAHFIELDRLRVAPDLLALVMGRFALARIDVDAPLVRLVEQADGRANWVLAGDGEAEPVPVHRLSVTNAEIRYRPPGHGQMLAVRIPAILLRDSGGSARVHATVAFTGRKIEIDADTDTLFAWNPPDNAFDGHLRIAAGDSRLESEFSLPAPSFPAAWQARLEADIKDLDRWIGLVPGVGPTGVGAVAMEASLERSGSTWKAEGVELSAMEGTVAGDLRIDTSGNVPELGGSIRASTINVAALRRAQPPTDEGASRSRFLSVPPVFPRLTGHVDVDIEQMAGLALPALNSGMKSWITDAQGRLRFGMHRLAAENVTIKAAGGTLEGSVRVGSAPDHVAGEVTLSARGLNLGAGEQFATASGTTHTGTISADAAIRLLPVARDSWDRAKLLRKLEVDTANIGFANPRSHTQLSATAKLAGDDARPVVRLSGTLKGRPLDVEIRGEALKAAWQASAYHLNARARSGGAELAVDTTLDSVLNIERFEGRIALSGDSIDDLERWLDVGLRPSPQFRVSGRLNRNAGQWKAEGFSVEIGRSNLHGSVRVGIGGRPRIAATLEAEPLDLAWLKSSPGTDAESADPPGNGTTDLAWLRSFDANLELDATELILPDGQRLDDLESVVALEAGVVDVERFSAGVAGGTFALEGRLDATRMPASARIDTRFDGIALGQLGNTFAPLEERLGLLSGGVHAVVTQTLDETFRDDIIAPTVGRLQIEPSELRFTDPEAGTDLRISMSTEGLADGEQRFRLDGNGRYDGDPVALRYSSDALLDIRLPDRPYAVDLDFSVVESHIKLDGTLLRPLALEGLDLQIALAGPNPQRLSRLLGVPLADLPPYRVSGQLGLKGDRWSLSDLDGTVGESDLAGRLALDVGPSPPRLTGEFRSDSLDIDDLAGIVGAEPAADDGAEAASESGDGQARRARFVLPDQPLIGDAWRQVTADVRYRGKSVRAGDVPLTDLVIDFRLKDGVARFDPVGFGVGDGSVDFFLELDASDRPADGTLSVEVRGVDLRTALKDWNLADDSVGIVGARGKFWVTGESVADLLGSADGGLVLLMSEGRLEAVLVELAGLDASQAFLAWVGNRRSVPIDCVYADLKAKEGRVRLDTFVVDTRDTIFTAGGQVDLDAERLDISIIAYPQDASVLIGRTPFHLGGTFDEIDAGIHGGELAARLGAGAGLAALASPLGALIPLLEAGVDDRTGYCQGLVERTIQATDSKGDGS